MWGKTCIIPIFYIYLQRNEGGTNGPPSLLYHCQTFYTDMNNTIRTLTVWFENEISQYEVPLLRGSVLANIGNNADVLFHNHMDEKYRYSFPLIQYKCIKKKACIVCIEDGVDIIGQLFASPSNTFILGNRSVEMQISSVLPRKTTIQAWENTKKYHLRRWLPLNSENFKTYLKLETLTERVAFLEHILIGNVLSMAKGLGIHFEKQVTCSITRLSEPSTVKVKNTKIMMFDADFNSNVSLPDWVGIGKHASIGFGIVTEEKRKIKNNDDEQHSA